MPREKFGSDMADTTLEINSPPTKFGGNKIAAHDGKIGCYTVEYTTGFLYSFLWHGINIEIQ